MWKQIWGKLKNPGKGILVIVYILTVVFCAFALGSLFIPIDKLWFDVICYVSYGIAALLLVYTVYTLIRVIPKMRKEIKEKLQANRVTGELMRNYGLRTVLTSALSTVITLAFAVYNGVLAVLNRSVWFAALASYYLLLLGIRAAIVLYHGRNIKKERKVESDIAKLRGSGIALLASILILSAAIFEIIDKGESFKHAGLMIYVVAAYTTLKITMSIVNFVRAKRQSDFTVDAIRNVNVADAAVSLLALQTSMLNTFSDGSMNYINAITGAGVCLIILGLSLYMIIRANVAEKAYRENKKEEDENGRTEQV